MYHSHSTTSRSAADDLRAYGLAGIDLQRAGERRHDRSVATLGHRGRTSIVRQRLGDAMIRFGTGIAGEAAKAPHVSPDLRPEASGA